MPTVRNTARVIATGLAAPLALGTATAAERAWIEVRSPHFVVISDARRSRRAAWPGSSSRSTRSSPGLAVGPRGPVPANPDPGRPGRRGA